MDVFDAIYGGHCALIATDTVYGLAALPGSPGFEQIFELKQRPSQQVLPWLVGSVDMMRKCAANLPDSALCLADAFWPGGLTVVVEASPYAQSLGCVASNDTVALRMPNESFVLELLRRLDMPLACTSANIHGRPACNRLEQLEPSMLALPHDLGIATTCAGGVSSTIVDCTGASSVAVLRLGAVSEQELAVCLEAAGFFLR